MQKMAQELVVAESGIVAPFANGSAAIVQKEVKSNLR